MERNVGGRIDRIDTSLQVILDVILYQQRRQSQDLDVLSDVLAERKRRTPGINEFRATDDTGVIMAVSGSPLPGGASIADRSYFRVLQQTAQTGLVISDPLEGRFGGELEIILARRITLDDGTFGGIVYATVALESLYKEFLGVNLGKHGAVSLRDGNMAIITRAPPVLDDGTPAIGQFRISKALSESLAASPREGVFVATSGIDGIDRVLSYRKIGDYPLYVIVGLAPQDFLTHWRLEVIRMVILLILFQGGGACALWWLLRSWKEKEQALATTSLQTAKLVAIQDSLPAGVVMLDESLRVLGGNAALMEMFRSQAAQMIGSVPQQYHVTEEQYQQFLAQALDVMAEGKMFRGTFQLRRNNGETFWCDVSGRYIDPGQTSLGSVWVLQDISDRRAAEDRLRASEERFRAMVEGVRDYAIIRLDATGQVETWNSGAKAAMGYDASEIVGRSFQVFLPDEVVESGLAALALSKARELGSYETEGWRVRKDGSRFWAGVVLTALRDGRGNVRGYVKILRDVTEQRRAVAEIQRLNAYLQAILNNSPVGISIVSLDRVIRRSNRALADLYGVSGDALTDRPISALYRDMEQYEDVGRRAYPLVLKGEIFCDEIQTVRTDGTPIWVRMMARLADVDNPSLGVVWTSEDITRFKELTDDLARSNSELERFAYVASHDLRQPLRTIASYLTLIDRRLGGETDGEIREFLDFAVNGARRMDTMIVDLLDYSRIGRQDRAAPQEVSLRDAVDMAVLNLRHNIQESGAEIVISSNLPIVHGNLSEFQRLFQNLIGNALKFHKPDQSPRIEVGVGPENGEIFVADNGIGIDPADHVRLFSIFSRLVAQDQYEGTGIGLATCRKIVEHHVGQIWLDSALGQGCTFHISLPEAKEVAAIPEVRLSGAGR